MNSLTVCVDFDDFLAITLPRNARHFSDTLVVTSHGDRSTQLLCERLKVKYHVTNAFYRCGAQFNKGAAIEEGLDILGRQGWICVWDCDIVMPESLLIPGKRLDCLYSPIRRILMDPKDLCEGLNWEELPSPTLPGEHSGYFQLFHADSMTDKPWYGVNWKHAGGCDNDLEAKFSPENKLRPPYSVLHLGAEGMPELNTRIGRNWQGRVIARIDTGKTPSLSESRNQSMIEFVGSRERFGLCREKIQTESNVPKRMSFFWQGSMSWLRYTSISSFIDLNPEWEVVIYRPETQTTGCNKWKTLGGDSYYKGKDYSHLLESYFKPWKNPIPNLSEAQNSDIFQWYILGFVGGFYADTDIIWMKPLENTWKKICTSDAIFCLEGGVPAVGLFASTDGGSQPFSSLYDRALRLPDKHKKTYQAYGVDLVCLVSKIDVGGTPIENRGMAIIRAFSEMYPSIQIDVMPDNTAYPLDWRQLNEIFEQLVDIPKASVGLHWFGGGIKSHKWNNLLTPENWKNYHTTLTHCIRTLRENLSRVDLGEENG